MQCFWIPFNSKIPPSWGKIIIIFVKDPKEGGLIEGFRKENIVLNFSTGASCWAKSHNPFVCFRLRVASICQKEKRKKKTNLDAHENVMLYMMKLVKTFSLIFSIMHCREFSVTLSCCCIAFSCFQMESFVLNMACFPIRFKN